MTSRFLKEMAKKEMLVPHLDGWFKAGKFPDTISFEMRLNKPKDDAFHPSSDGTPCARELYARRMAAALDVEYGRPFGGSAKKAFMVGHYWHELLQYVLVHELGFAKQADIEKEKVVRSGTWWAKGSIDIAHCDIPSHGDYLVDIKTMRAGEFTKALPSLWPKYFAQMQLYLDWEQVDTAIVLCVQKDSPHAFKEIIVKRDPAVVERIYDRWETVSAAFRIGMPPECDVCVAKEGACLVDIPGEDT